MSTYGSNISFVDDDVDVGLCNPRVARQTPGLRDTNKPQLEDESQAAAISPSATLPPAPLSPRLSASSDLPPPPPPPLQRSFSPNVAVTSPNCSVTGAAIQPVIPNAWVPRSTKSPVPTALGLLGVTQKCTFCDKSVYAVERAEADGMIFHKTCFRCDHCDKVIKSEDQKILLIVAGQCVIARPCHAVSNVWMLIVAGQCVIARPCHAVSNVWLLTSADHSSCYSAVLPAFLQLETTLRWTGRSTASRTLRRSVWFST